jgi:hypothetical protein
MPTLVPQRYEPAVSLDRLLSHPLNPRIHDDEAIAESLDAHGFYGAVLAQESSGRIIAGHGRLANAQARGYETLPVLWLDVDDDEAERLLLADNKTTDAGRYDSDRLTALLSRLGSTPVGLVGTGWRPDDLNALLMEHGAWEPPPLPPPPGAPARPDDMRPEAPGDSPHAGPQDDGPGPVRTYVVILPAEAMDRMLAQVRALADLWEVSPYEAVALAVTERAEQCGV